MTTTIISTSAQPLDNIERLSRQYTLNNNKDKIIDNERFKRQLPPYYYHQLQQQEAAEAAAAAAKKKEEEAEAKKEAESIANDLKYHELADGNYYSSKDIKDIIKRKYLSASEQVIKLTIDMLQRDVEFFTSKVEGDRFDNARLLIASRTEI